MSLSLSCRSLCLAVSILLPCAAGADGSSTITVEQIMARDFVGTPPENPYWSDDGRSIYYSKRRPGGEIVDLRRVGLATGRDEVVEGPAKANADYPGVWSRDRKTKAWIRDGDIFAKRAGRVWQLTRSSDDERDVQVLLDGRVAFRRGDSFVAADLDSGRQDTLADIRFAKDPDEMKEPEGFLEEQQRRLFDVLSEGAARKEERVGHDQQERRADATRSPRPWFFAEDRSLVGAWLAPTARSVLIAIGVKRDPADPDTVGAEGGKLDGMPQFVTDSGYVEEKKVRPKVGTGKAETPAIYLVDLEALRLVPIDLSKLPGLTDDPLADLRAKADAAKEKKKREREEKLKAEGKVPAPVGPSPAPPAPKSRPLHIDDARFSEDGAGLAIQLLSNDNKDRWLATIDMKTAAVASRFRQTDPAWLGWRFGDFGWTRDSRELWYLSEDTGYSHLYVQPIGGGTRRSLTRGSFEVDQPVLSRDGTSFFVSANREQAGTYEAYRVPLAGGALERLTRASGVTYAIPSLDEKQLLLTSSWPTKPPELFVQATRLDATARKLTSTASPELSAIEWIVPQVVEIPSRHFSGKIQARVYRPSSAGAKRGTPAVVFIHGAGYLQNAHAGWSGYFREFMFHTLLASRGYVVLDMDFRASSGYGRDHRTAIYRRMGEPEVEDLEDGVAWLGEHHGVDAGRVGAYGGSYGGFLTLMAMFRKPELFAAGAALRPVTDWAHYNHFYTSAILNTPELDPEAYDASSPIEYASGLAKPLLICHGMVDENVTFQDSVRLVQRLIELGKTDLFETAIYPFEAHGFKEPSSWTDEYKRILKLFETHLR